MFSWHVQITHFITSGTFLDILVMNCFSNNSVDNIFRFPEFPEMLNLALAIRGNVEDFEIIMGRHADSNAAVDYSDLGFPGFWLNFGMLS